uniref:Aldose 1-epimerase n=1 Tax=Fibrocapsa japonica TaxID=94617 RepID=A0A7S2USM4_9STRA|mmetsp:Transcript_1133/g.1536  ORF Transcript_1133/g.1536 Transcript_1133/m.1536 type:complete len:367 (+) Transcript_1133:16-1116(+)
MGSGNAKADWTYSEGVFGITNHDPGKTVKKINLNNGKGLEITLIDYGATLLSVKFPDRDGNLEELTLNYGDLRTMQAKSPYYGSTVGRVANRIANGKFGLNGKEYTIASNNGPHHLHGGIIGWDKVIWEKRVVSDIPDTEAGSVGCLFSHVSHDGDEGFPGTLYVQVLYWITPSNELHIRYKAELARGTTESTVVNMTNHAYWNLSGDLKEPARTHVLQVNASKYLPVVPPGIPTGEQNSVAGTAFDLKDPTELGQRLPQVDGGFDHCFVIDREGIEEQQMCLMGVLSHPGSGRKMEVYGTHPGLQVYTANGLPENAEESPHTFQNAVCMEAEAFPDAIHHSTFPSVILNPGQTYHHHTRHCFSII